MTVYFSSP